MEISPKACTFSVVGIGKAKARTDRLCPAVLKLGRLRVGLFLLTFGIPLLASAVDTDGDGLTDAQETALVLNPSDAFDGPVKISAGWNHTLYLPTPGSNALAWGVNSDGRCGLGNTASPVLSGTKVVGSDGNLFSDIYAVAAGSSHSLILQNISGVKKIYAAGTNAQGQLGLTNTGATRFTQVTSNLPTNLIAIAAGARHSLALGADGRLFAWGDNMSGQVGVVTNKTVIRSPMLVSNFSGVTIKAVGAGTEHTLALDSAGNVYAWGRGNSGQLGYATIASTYAPRQITGIPAMKQIATGDKHTLLLGTNGQVYACGLNSVGQLGLPSTVTYTSTPTALTFPAGTVIKKLVTGLDRAHAIAENGKVYGWGYNRYGELGLGYATTVSPYAVFAPTEVTNLFGAQDIAGGSYQTFALDSSGSLVASGLNEGGQLGIGSTNAVTGTSVPTKEIGKINQTITFPAPTGPFSVGVSLSLVASTSATNGIVVSFYSSDSYVATISGSTATFSTNGTVTITARQSGDATYNAATAVSQILAVVSKTTPTISVAPSASSITYGQTLNDSTLTGGTASTSGTFAFTTKSTAPSAGSANQSVTFTPADTANYNTATTTVSVPVNKATLTPTFSGSTGVTYDGTAHSLSASTTPSTLVNVTYDLSATAPTNAGVYTVVATVSDTNYTGTATTILTIRAGTVSSASITLTAPADLVYSGTAKSYTASAVGVSGFTCSYVGVSPTVYAASATAPTNAGGYAVTATSADSNYSGSQSTNFSITTKTLNITAEAKTKTSGDSDPALTFTKSGLVAGDSITGSLNRTVGETLGTYAITQGTLSAGSNYSISFTGADLTIVQPAEMLANLGISELWHQDSTNTPSLGSLTMKAGYTTTNAQAYRRIVAKIVTNLAATYVNVEQVTSTNTNSYFGSLYISVTNTSGYVEFNPTVSGGGDPNAFSTTSEAETNLPAGTYTFRPNPATITNFLSLTWTNGGAYPLQVPMVTNNTWEGTQLRVADPTTVIIGWNAWTSAETNDTISFGLSIETNSPTSHLISVVDEKLNGTNTSWTAGASTLTTNTTYRAEIKFVKTETGGAFRAKQTEFTLVTGPNYPPTGISLSSTSVPENSPNGTVVGTLSATDADGGETFTYAISGYDSYFKIVGNQLMTSSSILDYENKNGNLSTAHKASVTVKVTDKYGFTLTKTLLVEVINDSTAADDSDGDGLPDDWEVTYFGDTTSQSGGGDPDVDTFTNVQEYLGGTNPTNGTSKPNFGGAIGFASPTSTLTIPAPSSLGTGNFALEFWLKPTNLVSARQIVHQDGTITGQRTFSIDVTSAGVISAQLIKQGGITTNVATFSIAQPLAWNHVALVQEGTTLRLYVNGASGSSVTLSDTFSSPNLNPIVFGGTSNPYLGQIDDIRIFNTARTQAEIMSDLASPATSYTTNFVAYYKLDEVSGASAADATGRNGAGTAANVTWSPGRSPGVWDIASGNYNLENDGASLGLELGGTEPTTLYDQIFVRNGAATLDGIVNLMFYGSYTGPVSGSWQTFDLIWAQNGITFGSNYQLRFNQAGYTVDTAVVEKDGGQLWQATVRGVVTAEDLARAAAMAKPVLGISRSPGRGGSVEMLYTYTRPLGGSSIGGKYVVGGVSYEVQVSSDLQTWDPATIEEVSVIPAAAGYENVTVKVVTVASRGFLKLKVSN